MDPFNILHMQMRLETTMAECPQSKELSVMAKGLACREPFRFVLAFAKHVQLKNNLITHSVILKEV